MSDCSKWRKISILSQLDAITPSWSELNKVNGDCLFSSPVWIRNWINVYWQQSWQLEVWVYQQQGTLLALLPTYSQPCGKTGRVLYPLGQGEPEVAEVASEFIDLLLAPEFPSAELAALADNLNRSRFQRLSWRAILANANVLQLAPLLRYSQLKASGFRYQAAGGTLSLRSSQIQRKWRALTKLQANGRAVFSWLPAKQVTEYWPRLTLLHQQRWQAKGKSGAFLAPEFSQFHRDLAKVEPGFCGLAILWLDNEIAAIHYYLLGSGYVHFYQAGWQEKYARWSPSSMLHCWMIEQSKGAHYDFMLGGAQSYKADFGTTQRRCYQLSGFGNIIRYTLARLKQLKQRML